MVLGEPVEANLFVGLALMAVGIGVVNLWGERSPGPVAGPAATAGERLRSEPGRRLPAPHVLFDRIRSLDVQGVSTQVRLCGPGARDAGLWAENDTFRKLWDQNKGKPRWSFIDGPITANNPMGVHHAWGRTYKDLFNRFWAMRGRELRYQHGFDCQGLWVEVEVEKELGFKTKRDIETFGVADFVKLCKARVLKYAGVQTEQSIRLGYWMDWNDPAVLQDLAEKMVNDPWQTDDRGRARRDR